MREDVGKISPQCSFSTASEGDNGNVRKVKQSIFYSVYYKDELYTRTVMNDKYTHRT